MNLTTLDDLKSIIEDNKTKLTIIHVNQQEQKRDTATLKLAKKKLLESKKH